MVFGENAWGPGEGKSVFPWESVMLGSKGSEGDWCEQWGRGLAMPVLPKEGQSGSCSKEQESFLPVMGEKEL